VSRGVLDEIDADRVDASAISVSAPGLVGTVSKELRARGSGVGREGQDGEPVGDRADHHRAAQAPAAGEEPDQGGKQRPGADRCCR
jgi:hypothetical protein